MPKDQTNIRFDKRIEAKRAHKDEKVINKIWKDHKKKIVCKLRLSLPHYGQFWLSLRIGYKAPHHHNCPWDNHLILPLQPPHSDLPRPSTSSSSDDSLPNNLTSYGFPLFFFFLLFDG